VRGRLLTKGGRAVGGARLDVYHEVGGRLRRLGKTGLKTRPDGRLTLILPLNLDTRRIVLAYRAFRPGPITSRTTLKLAVRDRTWRSGGGMDCMIAGAMKGKFCARWAFEKKHPALQADVWPCRCWEDPKPETNEGVRRSTPQGPPRSSRRRTNCVTAVTRRC